MNRRRTAKPHLGFGGVILLIVSAVIVASAGVFHAHVKNRQINVSREIQRAENRISQHELDIRTSQMLLDEHRKRFVIRDRLRETNSDLREIPQSLIHEIDPSLAGGSAVAGRAPPGGPTVAVVP